MDGLTGKKVVMVVAPQQFRDEELLMPKKILEENGAQVVVACKGVKEALGMMEAKVAVDLDIGEIKVEDFNGIVFIGGNGARIYFNDLLALNIAKKAANHGKIIGAICIAPSILANAGILTGVRCTTFPTEKNNLKKHGAAVLNNSVVKDGKIITANGPEAAMAFGQKLVEALTFS